MVEAQTCIKKFVKFANKHNVKILKQTKNKLLTCRSASDTSVLWYFKIIKSAYIPAPPKEVKEIQAKLKDGLKLKDMNKEFFTYAKYDGLSKFTAFDINEGYTVARKIYCTLLAATDENKRKLQHLADLNKCINLKIQLRDGDNKVVFETK